MSASWNPNAREFTPADSTSPHLEQDVHHHAPSFPMPGTPQPPAPPSSVPGFQYSPSSLARFMPHPLPHELQFFQQDLQAHLTSQPVKHAYAHNSHQHWSQQYGYSEHPASHQAYNLPLFTLHSHGFGSQTSHMNRLTAWNYGNSQPLNSHPRGYHHAATPVHMNASFSGNHDEIQYGFDVLFTEQKRAQTIITLETDHLPFQAKQARLCLLLNTKISKKSKALVLVSMIRRAIRLTKLAGLL